MARGSADLRSLCSQPDDEFCRGLGSLRLATQSSRTPHPPKKESARRPRKQLPPGRKLIMWPVEGCTLQLPWEPGEEEAEWVSGDGG